MCEHISNFHMIMTAKANSDPPIRRKKKRVVTELFVSLAKSKCVPN